MRDVSNLLKFIVPLLVLVWFVSNPLKVNAQYPNQKDALVRMRGVKVLVWTSDDELKAAGLTSDVLKTDVELRLRKSGVRILEGKEWPEGYQKAALVVRVTIVKHNEIMAVAMTVQLWRIIDESATYISTWEQTGVGLFGESVVRNSVRERIGDKVDTFANDYLAVNPKP